jgi:hypothetical protein
MRPTPSGSTASGSPSRRTWAAGSSAPGPSSRRPSASATSPGTCWKPGPAPRDPLADKGFNGAASAAAQAARGTAVLVPPGKKDRAATPSILLKVIAEWRNRIETTFSEITDRMDLARHGAHTFWGLLTRTAATIAAHTLLRVCLSRE